MDFIPYKSNETLEHKYYQIPQELFINSKYKSKLNSDCKILYAFLLDRLSLSQKNHWIDEDNNVYLIFTREEVQEKLNLSDKTVTKSFKILMEVNLVQLLDILKNTPNIQNVKNYLMICLYNNLGNTNINNIIKKADTIKPNEREYPTGSLDFLYANFDMPTDTV